MDKFLRQIKSKPSKPDKTKAKDGASPRHWLSIKATVYHVTRDESFYETEFRTVDAVKKAKLIGREQFRRPSTVVDILLRSHAELPDDDKEAVRLVRAAVRDRSSRTYRLTNRTGWYGDSFVYLTETFGDLAGKLRHEGASDIDPALGLRQGTAEAWCAGLKNPCRDSDFLLFALSVPASGPLLDLIGEDEGAIFHFQPQNAPVSSSSDGKTRSSSGKTLAARAGMSEIGRCRKSDLVTFAATQRAVEDYCFAHNHLAALFDEEGRALSTCRSRKFRPCGFAHEAESGHHPMRCLRSSICLGRLSPTCSSRGAGLKSRISFFVISSILP
jgi:hypothetical protein